MKSGIGVFLYGSRRAGEPPIKMASDCVRRSWNRWRSAGDESPIELPFLLVAPFAAATRFAITFNLAPTCQG